MIKILIFTVSNYSKLKYGVTDAGELVSLSDEGITEIALNTADGTTYQTRDENGNTITNETTYSTSTSTGTVRDLWFTYENRDQDLPEVYFDMDGDGFAENIKHH